MSNDLVSDQRLHRVCQTLHQNNFDISLVGVLKSKVGQRNYETIQFKLPFIQGGLFYAFLNLRIFIFLLFHRCDIVIANDADTLLGVTLAKKLKRFQLFYDAHENFTEVPELEGREKIKKIWSRIEGFGIKNANVCYTVTRSVADALKIKYARSFTVVRNLPQIKNEKTSNEFSSRIRVLYQGVINKDRGLKQILPFFKPEHQMSWDLYGAGDEYEELKVLSVSYPQVELKGRVPLEELATFTAQYDIGVSVEDIANINYKESLPNKVLDYIQSGLPVIFTAMDEVVALNEQYHFGVCIADYDAFLPAVEKIKQQYSYYHENAIKAAKDLNWESEEKILLNLFSRD